MAPGDVTALLRAYEKGDREALNLLVPLLYERLRMVARRQLRRQPVGHSLEVTGLVNEAYLKLAGARALRANDREHFLAVAALAMRQAILGRARARGRAKRGQGLAVPLEEAALPAAPRASPEATLALDRALAALRRQHEGLARIFELRVLAGFSEQEAADTLRIPLRTAQRGYTRARAWLRLELGEGADGD